MKAIELPAYRAFMFDVVPRLVRGVASFAHIQEAIVEAERLWNAIDEHVDRVARELTQ